MTHPEPAKALGPDYWNGEGGQRWLAHLDLTEALLEPLGAQLLAAACVRPGQAVLDVGCGGAATTRALAAQVGPAGRAVGVDVSVPIIAVARARSANVAGLELRVADAATAALPGPFDTVVSRFGVMFFDDPVAAFRNLHGALAPGGRLAFLCWQAVERNDWLAVPAAAAFRVMPAPPAPADPTLPGPFAFADAERVRAILAAAGFGGVDIAPVDASMRWSDLRVARDYLLEMGMVGRALQDQPATVRDAVATAVAAELAARASDGGLGLACAAWLVTATA
jgi:SAM-dependent methyltransferase